MWYWKFFFFIFYFSYTFKIMPRNTFPTPQPDCVSKVLSNPYCFKRSQFLKTNSKKKVFNLEVVKSDFSGSMKQRPHVHGQY